MAQDRQHKINGKVGYTLLILGIKEEIFSAFVVVSMVTLTEIHYLIFFFELHSLSECITKIDSIHTISFPLADAKREWKLKQRRSFFCSFPSNYYWTFEPF